MKKECDDKIKAKQMEVQSLLERYNESVKSLDISRAQVGVLMEEKKEMELEINALKKENKRLRLKSIDVVRYETWEWEEVLRWIMMIEYNQKEKICNILMKQM
eukprot:984667_1